MQKPIIALALFVALGAAAGQPTRFDFRSGEAAPGDTKVPATTLYTGKLGYGYEPGSSDNSPTGDSTSTGQAREPFNSWGQMLTRFFKPDIAVAHHSDYGSYELARFIVQAVKDAKLPIAKYLVDTRVFDPAHPDPFASFDLPR